MTSSWRPSAALIVAIAINLVLIAAYVWSRGGQTTTVRIEARGDVFRAYVDGKLTLTAKLPAAETGGLSVGVFEPEHIPSIPAPASLDSVVVRDLQTRRVLLEEEFDDPALPGWQLRDSNVVAEVTEGTVRSGSRDFGVVLERVDADYGDVRIDLTYHNVTRSVVELRKQADGRRIVLHIEPWRDSIAMFSSAPSNEFVRQRPIEMDELQTTKSMVAMLLRSYPWMLCGLVALTVVAFTVSAVRRRIQVPARADRLWNGVIASPWVMAGLANFVFAVGLVLIYRYGDAIPHWPDAVAYVWQAKIFASGQIAADAPAVPPSFDFFYPPLIVVDGDRWSSIFPYGQSLVLAPGELVRAPWLIPPLIGGLSVALLWLCGRPMYGNGTAVLACVLFAASPFVLMQSSNFMSHSTAVFYMLASLYCLQRSNSGSRPIMFGALAGLAFGLLFGTRPLPAASVALPFGALFVTATWPRPWARELWPRIGAIALGLGVALAIFLLFNYGTTGNPLESAYRDSNSQRLGFGGDHSLAIGLQNQQANLATLLLVLQGWPQFVGLGFVLLPLVLASRNRWDWFCGACAVLLIVGPVLFIENGIMQGPRMWYEATPFLCFLAARGALLAAGFASSAAFELRQRFLSRDSVDREGARLVTSAVSVAVVLSLVGWSIFGWLLGQRESWQVMYVPASPGEMRDFNGVDDRITRMAEQGRLEDALVIVKYCPHWQCYGSVFWTNNIALDGDVVFARDLPEQNAALFAAYPDRRVFVADYDQETLTPYGAVPGSVPSIPRDPNAAPRARDIVVTPTTSP